MNRPAYCKCAFTDPDGTFVPGEACALHPDVTPQRTTCRGCTMEVELNSEGWCDICAPFSSKNVTAYVWSGEGMIPAVEGEKRLYYRAEDVAEVISDNPIRSVIADSIRSSRQQQHAADTALARDGSQVETSGELKRLRKLEEHVERVACWVNPQDVYLEIRRTRDDIYNAREERRRAARSVEETSVPMSGFMCDSRNGIVPDPNYRTRFKVGERILPTSALYRYRPCATVTEITARGFKYRHDERINLGPRHGWYQEGESFTDDGWDLAADQSPAVNGSPDGE